MNMGHIILCYIKPFVEPQMLFTHPHINFDLPRTLSAIVQTTGVHYAIDGPQFLRLHYILPSRLLMLFREAEMLNYTHVTMCGYTEGRNETHPLLYNLISAMIRICDRRGRNSPLSPSIERESSEMNEGILPSWGKQTKISY